MPSLIPLFDLPASPQEGGGPRILQLYQDLELFSEGEPQANSLFVLGRALNPDPGGLSGPGGLWRDQLLVVDPPANLEARFRLEGDIAVLETWPAQDSATGAAPRGPAELLGGRAPARNLPHVQTVPGGVAHIRVGEHFLDIYSQRVGSIVHLPAIGVLLGGVYGSDVTPPRLAPGSDGEEELDALRLIARILKTHHFQLYLPRLGTMAGDKLQVMERLAADVAYLHGLRRVIPALVARGEPWELVETVGASLLPGSMQTPAAREVHSANLRALSGE
jgi:hypothetical protein